MGRKNSQTLGRVWSRVKRNSRGVGAGVLINEGREKITKTEFGGDLLGTAE